MSTVFVLVIAHILDHDMRSYVNCIRSGDCVHT